MTFLTVGDTFLTDMGEKLTLIAALCFFLWYFMRELKDLKAEHDSYRKASEEKQERVTERLVKLEESTRSVIEKNNQSNERLAATIEELSDKINGIISPLKTTV